MERLPTEIVEFIIDRLYDYPEALKNCRFVCKSWDPRARNQLFRHVEFVRSGHFGAWQRVFSDPASSPVEHTHSLYLECAESDIDEHHSLIESFINVERLDVWGSPGPSGATTTNGRFAPFCELKLPKLKSLRVGWECLQFGEVMDLICSFSFENLHVWGKSSTSETTHRSWDLSKLTGTLVLEPVFEDFVLRLLELPNDLHFRKIVLGQALGNKSDRVKDLVERCSSTLECIKITRLESGSVDLSKTKKLKEVDFLAPVNEAGWIVSALGTITPEHEDLEQVSIYITFDCITPGTLLPVDFKRDVGEEVYSKCMDLDRALNEFWEAHPGRVKIMCCVVTRTELTLEKITTLVPVTAAEGRFEFHILN